MCSPGTVREGLWVPFKTDGGKDDADSESGNSLRRRLSRKSAPRRRSDKLYYTVWNKRPDHEKKADFESPSKARTCDSKTASQRQYQGDARRLAQLRPGCADRRWHRRCQG